MDKLLIHKKYPLEKFPGKGGWTYVRIPEISGTQKTAFGWVKVKGSIDTISICQYKLAPMKHGGLFLPVKAAIRKIIGKQAGDWVEIRLYEDIDPLIIPDEFMDCLRDEPLAHAAFLQFSESAQKKYIDWIYSAKKEASRIDRLSSAINEIRKGKKKL